MDSMQNLPAPPDPAGSRQTTTELLNSYLGQIQEALDKEMSPARLALYMHGLADLTEAELHDAFGYALKNSKFIPAIAELREWATNGSVERHRLAAQNRTRALLDRPNKPDDWNPKLDDLWADIERRHDERELRDLAHVEMYSDAQIEALVTKGPFYPGPDLYVDWLRRKEARDRKAKGIPRPRTRAALGPMFERIQRSAETQHEREPGAEG